MAVAAPRTTVRTKTVVARLCESAAWRDAPRLALQRLVEQPRPTVAIETPQLSVVIVNYCQWRNTARLTQQLRQCEAVRRGAAEIVVVDNHSPKHPIVRKLRRLSGVSVVHNRENQGFAKAVNRGGRISRGEWVLLLNPDVTVPPGFLDAVLESAQRSPAIDPNLGVIGFQLRNRDGSKQASSGVFPSLWRTLFGLLRPRGRRKCHHQTLKKRQSVEWVTGGCLLVRRDCFEQLDGMDESYFLYYEDVDFCRRAAQAGWSIWYEPALRVTHHFPLHTRGVSPGMRLVTRHALLMYARKHWPRWQSKVMQGIIWLEASARIRLARWRKRPDDAATFLEMRKIVGDVAHGRDALFNQRIRRAARGFASMASAQDGRTTE